MCTKQIHDFTDSAVCLDLERRLATLLEAATVGLTQLWKLQSQSQEHLLRPNLASRCRKRLVRIMLGGLLHCSPEVTVDAIELHVVLPFSLMRGHDVQQIILDVQDVPSLSTGASCNAQKILDTFTGSLITLTPQCKDIQFETLSSK